MNESLVKAIKSTMSSQLEKFTLLKKEYEMVKKTEPTNIQAQNEIAIKAQDVLKDYNTTKAELSKYEKTYSDYVNLCGAQSIESDERKSKELEKAVCDAYDNLIKLEDELAEKYDVTIEREVEPIEEEEEEYTSEKPKKGTAKKIIAGVLTFATAFGLGYCLRGCSDTRMSNYNTALVDTTNQEEKEPGEYGTFLDATDDEQVKARAQYIYDNYYSNWVNELTPEQQKNITPEKIANIIRVMNGELPLDEDGNRYYDVNVVDETVNSFVNITANLPSSSTLDSKTNEEIGQIKDIPMHMFAVDGSETSEFIKPYDEDFTNIIDGRNHHNGEKTVNAIKSLGEKMYREFVMVGRNYQNDDGTLTNYRNPYDLPAQQRALAWIGATQRYGAIALPYNLNGMQAVCIDVCVNYNTKELNAIPVNEIYEGYHSGLYSSIIARLAGLPEKHDPDTIGFVQDLNDQLEFKYKELKQMTLK